MDWLSKALFCQIWGQFLQQNYKYVHCNFTWEHQDKRDMRLRLVSSVMTPDDFSLTNKTSRNSPHRAILGSCYSFYGALKLTLDE